MLTIIACGDLHYRGIIPENRQEDYLQLQLEKWQFVLAEAEANADIVVLPGDLFNDYGNEPYWLVEEFVKTIKDHPYLVFLVTFGQHDTRYHIKDLANTPFKLLVTSLDNFKLLGKKPFNYRKCNFYGEGFGEDTIKPLTEGTNILLCHKMIVKDDELYPGQGAITDRNMLRTHNFDIIVSGDNHQCFTEEIAMNGKHKLLVNMGSLMRMKTDQKEHKPSICKITIDNGGEFKYKVIPIPILPSKKVFVGTPVGGMKILETGESFMPFVEGLKEDSNINLDFVAFLRKRLAKEKGEVKSFIEECLTMVVKGGGDNK